MKGVDLSIVVDDLTIQITADDGWTSWPCVAAIDGDGIGAAAARALAAVPGRWDEVMIVSWSGALVDHEMLEVAQAVVAWQAGA